MARDSSRRQLRLLSPAPWVAISWIAIGSLVVPSLCKTTRAQDLVPAPPDMEIARCWQRTVDLFTAHPRNNRAGLPRLKPRRPILADELERPLASPVQNPFATLGDRSESLAISRHRTG